MAVKDGRTVMPFGVMGGDYQPFGHVHLLTNLLDFGFDLQEALDAPRVFYDAGILEAEHGVVPATVEGLVARGHQVQAPTKPLGGGQAV